MKALPPASSSHQQFLAVRLYRDDLERIVDLLRGTGADVEIKDDRFAYESIEELSNKAGRSPKIISLRATLSHSLSSVGVTKSDRYWYFASNGEAFQPVEREIEGIIRSRQSRLEALPIHWLFQIGNLTFWVGLATRARFSEASTGLMTLGGALLIISLLLTVRWWTYPKAVLKYRHEAGFIVRNRDAILLLVVGAIIGGIVQYILGRLLKP